MFSTAAMLCPAVDPNKVIGLFHVACLDTCKIIPCFKTFIQHNIKKYGSTSYVEIGWVLNGILY